MVRDEKSLDAFRNVLKEDLQHPLYLTPEEVGGGWCEIFPALATSLPAPFPIFGRDEEHVVTWGYPLLLSDGVRRLRRDLDNLIRSEVQLPFAAAAGKQRAQTDRARPPREVPQQHRNHP